jgi:hypothetical protein
MQVIKDILLLRLQLTTQMIQCVWIAFLVVRCMTLWSYLEATYNTTQSLGPSVLWSIIPRILEIVIITAVVGVFLKVASGMLAENQK